MNDHHQLSDRDLLILILERQELMALDLTKLSAAVSKVSTDVDALVAAHGTAASAAAAQAAADQASVDALVPTVEALSTKIEAALTPPAA